MSTSLQTDLSPPAAAPPLAVIPDNMTVAEMMVLMLQYQSFHSFVHYPTSTSTSMNVHDVETDGKNTNTTNTMQQQQQQKQVDNSEDPKAQGSRLKKRCTPPNKIIVNETKNNENSKRKRRGKLSDDERNDNVVQRRRSKRSKQTDNVLTPLHIASCEPWNLHAHAQAHVQAHAESTIDYPHLVNVHGVKPVPTVVELSELDHGWFQQQQQQQQHLYGANPNDDLPLSPSELLLNVVVEESYDEAAGDFRFQYNEINDGIADMHTTGETTIASSPVVSSVDDFLIASPFPVFDLSFDTESQTSTTSSDTTMAEEATTTNSTAPKAIAKLQSIFDQQQKVFSAYCAAIQTNQTLMLNR